MKQLKVFAFRAEKGGIRRGFFINLSELFDLFFFFNLIFQKSAHVIKGGKKMRKPELGSQLGMVVALSAAAESVCDSQCWCPPPPPTHRFPYPWSPTGLPHSPLRRRTLRWPF